MNFFLKSFPMEKNKFDSIYFSQESERLTDEDLFKILTDFRKPPTLAKKPKTIPGELILFQIRQ